MIRDHSKSIIAFSKFESGKQLGKMADLTEMISEKANSVIMIYGYASPLEIWPLLSRNLEKSVYYIQYRNQVSLAARQSWT